MGDKIILSEESYDKLKTILKSPQKPNEKLIRSADSLQKQEQQK